jgi:Spy/CpxP family protein refolding chaperone
MRSQTLTRSKLFWTLTMGAALVLGLTATQAFAQRGAGGPPDAGAEQGRPQRGAWLGLSDAQQTEMKKLRQAKRAAAQPLRAQMQVKRAELSALWLAADIDKGALLRVMGELRHITSQLDEAHVDFKLSALRLLTPEQRVKFLERTGRGQRGFMGGHHGRGGQRGFHGRRGGKRGERGCDRGQRGFKRGGPRGFGGGGDDVPTSTEL